MRTRHDRGPGLDHTRKDSTTAEHDQARNGTGADGRGEGDEGYVLALVTIGIFAILVLVGLVVDVGGWYSKASKEQRASDAAALAGAQMFAETGSWPAAVVEAERVATQNGFSGGGDVSVTVTQVGTSGVKVTIREENVELFFAQLATSDVSIERSSVATPAGCGAECDQDITLGKPFSGISLKGDGDGFGPTLVGADRVYALNHHVPNPSMKSMLCVERDTNTACAGYPKSPGAYTTFTSTLAYHPGLNALYYLHQNADNVALGCWSVTTDAACGTAVLNDLPVGTFDQHTLARGSSPVIIGSNAYVQTDDYSMHCVVLASLSPCAGSPYNTSYTAARDAGSMPVDSFGANGTLRGGTIGRGNTFTIDMEVIGDEIYSALVLRNTTFQNGAHIACFNSASNAPCTGWDVPTYVPSVGSYTANDRAWRNHPYLFVRYTSGNSPSGICVHDSGGHGCANLGGGNAGNIGGFDSYMKKAYNKSHAATEARLGNKTFFPNQNDDSTRCWDWSTNSGCGDKNWGTSVDPEGGTRTSDYGYASDGNCIFALGHTALFWSFDENFERCFGGATAVEVNPCICSTGEPVYGSLEIPAEVLAELDEATAEVVSLFGTELIAETDLLATGGILDMSGIDPAGEGSVILKINVKSDSYDLDGDVWENAISASADVVTRPVLTD